MTEPQQPELRRSGKGATDRESAKAHAQAQGGAGAHGSADAHGTDKGNKGGVPPEQQSPYPS